MKEREVSPGECRIHRNHQRRSLRIRNIQANLFRIAGVAVVLSHAMSFCMSAVHLCERLLLPAMSFRGCHVVSNVLLHGGRVLTAHLPGLMLAGQPSKYLKVLMALEVQCLRGCTYPVLQRGTSRNYTPIIAMSRGTFHIHAHIHPQD